jgi:hypothetical protein
MKGCAVNRPDRALRLTVGRLADLAPSDSEAILDGLTQRQRARVSGLLDELNGTAKPAPRFDAKALPPGLSPWLLERLGIPPDEGAVLAGAALMSDHALRSLKACAAELDPAPPEPEPLPSLIGQAWHKFVAIIPRRSQPA